MAVNKHQNVSQPLQNRLKAASRVIATVNLRDENYVEHRVRGGGKRKDIFPHDSSPLRANPHIAVIKVLLKTARNLCGTYAKYWCYGGGYTPTTTTEFLRL